MKPKLHQFIYDRLCYGAAWVIAAGYLLKFILTQI